MDNNGFIIISENTDHTGRFFGQIDGTIMDSLVQDRIYKKVAVYDYQGACTNSKNNYRGASFKISVSNFGGFMESFDVFMEMFEFSMEIFKFYIHFKF